ncbi:protease modulator HflC [Pseudoroseicyclus tamaricis]|uniref:Protease modulator HflC n=1 Tax=Pseudoroseicyclus tamaricis TaxID=2705421 RepID=A0A6B2JG73_9RHOB|nr:protease modulator HflC [Pseudoroseicyclus tamaricis]NDV00151.1 protease modulator HflC [Pseudoroseicyclus tamaricis]
MRRAIYIIPAVVIVLLVALSSLYVVNEKEKALVLQFGQIVTVKEDPGLGVRIPIIQDVVRYDDRILSLDTQTIEVTPSDDRRLVVDAFARYRIADVVAFRRAVGVGGIATAENRLASILNSQIREVLGADQVTSDTILSADRRLLMTRIRDQARASAMSLGIDVVDVRLKQTNLPPQNLDATFSRMRAEREREAADEVARGNEAAQRVRALADRTVVETSSEAEREAQITRGEADAEANRIFAEAYGANPEFFDFYRSLQAYRAALSNNNSSMVMTPDSEFFDYLYSDDIAAPSLPAGDGSADLVELDEPGSSAGVPAIEPQDATETAAETTGSQDDAAADEGATEADDGDTAGTVTTITPTVVEPEATTPEADEPVTDEPLTDEGATEDGADVIDLSGDATVLEDDSEELAPAAGQ